MATAVEQRTYGMRRLVALSYEEAVERTRQALSAEGFGVLTEIDVKATMKAKLDVDVPAQLILGACNPPLALRALIADPEVGLLLPCNVVVREEADGTVIVEALDPEAALALAKNDAIAEVAHEARERLRRALTALPGAER